MNGARDFRLNRVLSGSLTAFLLKLPLTPNHITAMSLLAGLGAGFLFARGTAAASIAGALCYQLACVLDNCDGEVARAKNLRSEFGGWFDIAADFTADVSLFSGVAYGARRAADSRAAEILLGLCLAGAVLHLGFVVWEKKRGFGPAVYEAPNARSKESDNAWLRFFDALREGDASWIVLLFALIGQMPLFLWLAAFYMQFLWLSAFAMNRRFLR